MDYAKFRDRLKASAQDIRDRGRRLAELNMELAKAELKRVAGLYGAAAGMLVAAGLLVLYGLGFLFATICIALDIVLPLWAAALIVTVLLFLLAATLTVIARAQIMAARSPKPDKAVAEAKSTATTIQSGARKVAARAKDAARGKNAASTSAAGPATPSPATPAAAPKASGAGPAPVSGAAGEQTPTDSGES